MTTSENKAKRARIGETVAHYLTAFVVLLKGFDKISHSGKIGIGLLFITIGLLIAAGTIFHHKLEHVIKNFKAYVMLLEAIVLFALGYTYLKDDYHYLQYVCFAAALAYLVVSVVLLMKSKATPAHH